MLLALLKRVVKIALHEAVEEWALETGLPRKVVEEMRARRLALAAQTDAHADALAAANLGVEDEEVQPAPALLMVSVAQTTTQESCPTPGSDDSFLMAWVHQRRQAQVNWADISRSASEAGHSITEEALRTRYRRWREKQGQAGNHSAPSA